VTYTRTTLAVWEVTLSCGLACSHCGSRAGTPRRNELTTDEALDLVGQLAEAGIGEVALIGGEAFLRPDWLDIAEAIRRAGMVCSMTTSGFGLSEATARRMKQAGLRHVSVSIDGLEQSHDLLRRKKGAFASALVALRSLSDAGLFVGANSQVNRITAPDLPELYEVLRRAGVQSWQLQLTVPSGNAADHPEILLQPCELIDFFDMLARIAIHALQDGMSLSPGNNIGYHGPFTELLVAAGGTWSIGEGCLAGISVLGIEADGTIKSCPSLPAAGYSGGNVRDVKLAEMLTRSTNLGRNHRARTAPLEDLWGFCRACEFATVCRGGCTWTAQAFFGRPGNNPYCHHRALKLAESGQRERVLQVSPAPGIPFDSGTFQIVQEPLTSPWPNDGERRFGRDLIRWPARS